ncbi:MAG: hypothetical protein V8T45_10815 [Oscillospiraceae bacterium]
MLGRRRSLGGQALDGGGYSLLLCHGGKTEGELLALGGMVRDMEYAADVTIKTLVPREGF